MMNALTRHDAKENEHGLDRWFGAMLNPFFPEFMQGDFAGPHIELEAEPDKITAKLAIPGCRKEDIDVEVCGDCMTVKARRKIKECDGRKHFIRRECASESFEETVRLPANVKGGETKAEYKDGVLQIVMPRLTPREERRAIEVK